MSDSGTREREVFCMTIIMVLFFIVFPVLLIFLAIKYSKLKKEYLGEKEKTGKISDADKYSASKHYDADVYYKDKVKSADDRFL